MKFSIQTGDFKAKPSDCLVIGIFEKGLSGIAKKWDENSNGYLSQLIKSGDFEGKMGQFKWLHNIPGLAPRVLLMGCGKEKIMKIKDFRRIILVSVKEMNASKTLRAVFYLTELPVEDDPTTEWKIKQIVTVASDSFYQFNQYKSEKETRTFNEISIFIDNKANKKSCLASLKEGMAIAEGVELTKDLANQPSNICTPTYLANQAKVFAKEQGIKINILEEKDMKKLGMGALLAVAKGSAEPPKLICLEYLGGKKKEAPTVLIGKGITFDTGGISLKPADSMIGMKYDMCGAATVLGVMKAVSELKLPINLVGLLVAAENMPSGAATKPEDIVTTLSGQTVEILNTDAEGRLILCDALTFCERYKPAAVIDIATLTGAVVIALGYHATGLLSNNEILTQDLLKAGNEIFDRAWALPLWEEYQEQLKSPFADMSNIGGRSAGTITAACFLSRFAKKFPWAHLDVAGTAAMMGGTDRYATGRPVPMLVQYLMDKSF